MKFSILSVFFIVILSCSYKPASSKKTTDIKSQTGYYDETFLLSFNEVLQKYAGYIKFDCNSENQLDLLSCNCQLFFLSETIQPSNRDSVAVVLYGSDSLETYSGVLYVQNNAVFIRSLEKYTLFPCQRWIDLAHGAPFSGTGQPLQKQNITSVVHSDRRVYDEPLYSTERKGILKRGQIVELLDKKDNWMEIRTLEDTNRFWVPAYYLVH